MGDGSSVLDAQWSEWWGWRLGIVCVCVCVRAIFSTLPPRSPSVLPQVCHSLASICRRPLAPTPVYPLPLSWSPFCQDEKILILMALRLFSFFFFFCNTTVVRWPFLHATRMQPSDRSAKSAHLHTHLHTLLHTHTHTLRRSRAWFRLVFPALPTPTSTMAPSSPPVFLRETQLWYPRLLPTPPSAFFSPSCFPQNWCVAVHGISMLESLWGRGFHRRRIGMEVDDINGFFFFFPFCQISTG